MGHKKVNGLMAVTFRKAVLDSGRYRSTIFCGP